MFYDSSNGDNTIDMTILQEAEKWVEKECGATGVAKAYDATGKEICTCKEHNRCKYERCSCCCQPEIEKDNFTCETRLAMLGEYGELVGGPASWTLKNHTFENEGNLRKCTKCSLILEPRKPEVAKKCHDCKTCGGYGYFPFKDSQPGVEKKECTCRYGYTSLPHECDTKPQPSKCEPKLDCCEACKETYAYIDERIAEMKSKPSSELPEIEELEITGGLKKKEEVGQILDMYLNKINELVRAYNALRALNKKS